MDLIILVGAIVVTLLVFTLLVKVVKTAISTAITIALIILLIQLAFGISPVHLFQQIGKLWNSLWQLITN